MAALTLKFETELVADLVAQLCRIEDALRFRHGDAFRALERRIEAFTEQPSTVSFQALDAEISIATPPRELVELIQEAERLGIIVAIGHPDT